MTIWLRYPVHLTIFNKKYYRAQALECLKLWVLQKKSCSYNTHSLRHSTSRIWNLHKYFICCGHLEIAHCIQIYNKNTFKFSGKITTSKCPSINTFWRIQTTKLGTQHEKRRPWTDKIRMKMGLDQPLIFMLLMSSWMIQMTYSNTDCPEQCVCMWKSGKETTECINRYVNGF